MAEKVQLDTPNYKRIYLDIIQELFPNRWEELRRFFSNKAQFSSSDVRVINKILFGSQENKYNAKLRVYSQQEITDILKEQKKLRLNNSQAAIRFNVSRNSIIKWNKIHQL